MAYPVARGVVREAAGRRAGLRDAGKLVGGRGIGIGLARRPDDLRHAIAVPVKVQASAPSPPLAEARRWLGV
jgi:hypothetical protein